jgi:histidinol-phosphate aminotransferase
MVLVDEAYIHFSEAPSAVKLLGARKDLIVMRTFSKLFGMAGIRLGITFADPEVQKKLSLYNAVGGGISITAMACGAAVYNEDALIKARRNEMTANREETIAWLTKKGIEVQGGSHANMFMVDWKKPAKDMQMALLAERVQIGRNWAIWPTTSRITVGSAQDMAHFRAAVEKTYKA